MKNFMKFYYQRSAETCCYGKSTREIILDTLKSGPCTRRELRNIVLEYGKKPNTFLRRLFDMRKADELMFNGSAHSPKQIILLK